ncbi:MAG: hypothetical protein ACREEJ_08175 [Ensifer adhaerens]
MIGRNGIFADAGPYWTLPLPIDKLELHPALLQEIEAREDSRAFEAYLLMIFDETSAPPSGIMEFALNRRSKCACAIYEAKRVSRPLSRRFSNAATKPLWIKARTAQHAANIFYQAIVDRAQDI